MRLRARGAEPVGDRREHERAVAERCERDEERRTVCLLGQQPGELDREARLAGTARPDDREHTRIALEDERDGLEELALAPEETGRGRRQVDAARRTQRRKLSLAELMEAGRALEVLQPMQAEVAERLAVEEGGRRRRDDRLAAVGERSDARAAVHVDADVALGGELGSSGVQADAHADRPVRERLAAGPRGVGCALGGREGDEEGVALRVDLDAAVGRERLAQRAPVLGERLAVRVRAELPEQARRALDVGEEERDRAGREHAVVGSYSNTKSALSAASAGGTPEVRSRKKRSSPPGEQTKYKRVSNSDSLANEWRTPRGKAYASPGLSSCRSPSSTTRFPSSTTTISSSW